MNVKRVFSIFVFCLLIGACKSGQVDEFRCSNEITTPLGGELRKEKLFELVLADDEIPLYVGDVIPLKIINLSDHELWFPPDLNMFLVKKTEDFIGDMLSDLLSAPSSDYIVLRKSGFPNDTYEFTILPSLFDDGTVADVDIMIRGYIYQDGKICDGVYGSLLTVKILPKD